MPGQLHPALPDDVTTGPRGTAFALTLTRRRVIATICSWRRRCLRSAGSAISAWVRPILPRVLDGIDAHSRLVAADLQSDVRSWRADVTTFGSRAAHTALSLLISMPEWTRSIL